MPEDVLSRLRRIQGLAAKLEVHHTQIDEMMSVMKADGLSAMPYGQYGGSFPDPTAAAVYDVHGDERKPVVWRDHAPEDDRASYYADLEAIEKALERMDAIRRRYMSANLDARNRLDPTEWCRIHFHLQLQEGHKRWKGDMCATCYRYKEENGHEPTPTEVTYHHVHGRWPHKLYDPKARKAV